MDVGIVATEETRRKSLEDLVSAGSFVKHSFTSTTQAERFVKNNQETAVMILDSSLSEDAQLSLLANLSSISPALQVIVIAHSYRFESALRAFNQGAFWFLHEDYANEDFLLLITRALVSHHLKSENITLREALKSPISNDSLIAESPAMKNIMTRLHKIALLDASVLLTGESGTGKTAIAALLHRNSQRNSGPYMSLSCANLPHDLMQSELFGHEKGAFTGANNTRPGILELAHAGTVFLDEIGELPIDLQPKLLTFLQDKNVRRLGSNVSRAVNVRVLYATNKDLAQEVSKGAFREDLYYRINVISLHIPTLRERAEDIAPLSRQILKRIAQRRERETTWNIDQQCMKLLQTYEWPGNVRELEHTLERASAFSEGQEIDIQELKNALSKSRSPNKELSVGMTLKQAEEWLINQTLKDCQGNKKEAARILGISLKTIYNKLNEPLAS